MEQVELSQFKTVYPNCAANTMNTDKFFECLTRNVVLTFSHHAGTCKMGDPKDHTTDVDPHLRVKGIEGLRIVDASVMPIVTSGSTNAPTIMIAEKASDIIKQTIRCPTG
ncbi:unnamed protein product, partial [Larinioides sclopetarius]